MIKGLGFRVRVNVLTRGQLWGPITHWVKTWSESHPPPTPPGIDQPSKKEWSMPQNELQECLHMTEQTATQTSGLSRQLADVDASKCGIQ